jgi:hypothetical protein
MTLFVIGSGTPADPAFVAAGRRQDTDWFARHPCATHRIRPPIDAERETFGTRKILVIRVPGKRRIRVPIGPDQPREQIERFIAEVVGATWHAAHGPGGRA